MRRKNVAVAGVIIYRGELVQFLLCQGVQRLFTVALLSHLAQIIFGLIAEYRLAKCVIAVPQDKVIAGDRFHLLTPFLWGISVVLSLSAKVTFEKPPATRQTPLFATFFEKMCGRWHGTQETTKFARKGVNPPGERKNSMIFYCMG